MRELSHHACCSNGEEIGLAQGQAWRLDEPESYLPYLSCPVIDLQLMQG